MRNFKSKLKISRSPERARENWWARSENKFSLGSVREKDGCGT